jgi:arylsulfatase A-like enzyme
MSEIRAQGLLDSTLVILTAKSGNSPIDPATRRAVDPAQYNTIINAAVGAGMVAQVTADTVALIWLKDHSKAIAAGNAVTANAAALGAQTVWAGSAPCTSSNCPRVTNAFNGAFAYDQSRRPDVVVQPVPGVVYTTGTKLADHGGFTDDDIHVPLMFSQPKLVTGSLSTAVDLRQVAPTILTALGLDKTSLQAWTLEGTDDLGLTYTP